MQSELFPPLSRRDMLQRVGTGLGVLGLAGILSNESQAASPLAAKQAHFPAKAKRVIHLFMNGGPSQVDTFDPKPGLTKYNGKNPPAGVYRKTERGTRALMQSPFKFSKHGQSGVEVSDLFPNIATCIDDMCVIRSMHTDVPNHEPSLLMMTCGNSQPVRPSMGSWLLYGLGAENQDLPGFVVMCPGKPVVGPQLWSSSFLPGIYQGTHINNSRLDPKSVMPNLTSSVLPRGAQREQLELMQKFNELHFESRRDNPLEARIQSMEMAFRMQFEAQEVFDLKRETAATRERYGKGPFADACLAARRWSSAACAWCRFSPATANRGTITPTSRPTP